MIYLPNSGPIFHKGQKWVLRQVAGNLWVPVFCSNVASFELENRVFDRVLRIAQVLALLWIGYELHALANPEVESPEAESTVDSATVLAPRL